jgi:hypothetical protein
MISHPDMFSSVKIVYRMSNSVIMKSETTGVTDNRTMISLGSMML